MGVASLGDVDITLGGSYVCVEKASSVRVLRYRSGGPSVRWRPASHGGARTSASQWSVVVALIVVRGLVLRIALIAGLSRGCVLVLLRAPALVRLACVSRRPPRSAGSVPRPCASAPPALAARPRAAPAFGSCLRAWQSPRVASRSGSSLVCGVRRGVHATRSGRRGKLALMVRKEALLHQPPNRFIERTASGRLRLPPAAAHVGR